MNRNARAIFGALVVILFVIILLALLTSGTTPPSDPDVLRVKTADGGEFAYTAYKQYWKGVRYESADYAADANAKISSGELQSFPAGTKITFDFGKNKPKKLSLAVNTNVDSSTRAGDGESSVQLKSLSFTVPEANEGKDCMYVLTAEWGKNIVRYVFLVRVTGEGKTTDGGETGIFNATLIYLKESGGEHYAVNADSGKLYTFRGDDGYDWMGSLRAGEQFIVGEDKALISKMYGLKNTVALQGGGAIDDAADSAPEEALRRLLYSGVNPEYAITDFEIVGGSVKTDKPASAKMTVSFKAKVKPAQGAWRYGSAAGEFTDEIELKVTVYGAQGIYVMLRKNGDYVFDLSPDFAAEPPESEYKYKNTGSLEELHSSGKEFRDVIYEEGKYSYVTTHTISDGAYWMKFKKFNNETGAEIWSKDMKVRSFMLKPVAANSKYIFIERHMAALNSETYIEGLYSLNNSTDSFSNVLTGDIFKLTDVGEMMYYVLLADSGDYKAGIYEINLTTAKASRMCALPGASFNMKTSDYGALNVVSGAMRILWGDGKIYSLDLATGLVS